MPVLSKKSMYPSDPDVPQGLEELDEGVVMPTEKPCAICEKAEGTVDALWDDRKVKVCPECFHYETGEEPKKD